MNLLARVVRNEAGPIAAAMFVLATLLMVAASFAFIAEHEAQPEAFASIPDAMWWTIVTMTTVGYGDMVPVTPLGKVLGGVIAVIGLGMVALPAGLLAAGFSEQLHIRKRAFEDEVHNMLKDGVIFSRRERSAGGRPGSARAHRSTGVGDHAPDQTAPRLGPLPALRTHLCAGTAAAPLNQ